MLVATSGQTATFSLLGSSAQKKSSTTPKSTTSSSIGTSSNCNTSKSSNSTASTLIKTISVRINRGTEFLKDTVQKALIANNTSSKNHSTTASSISFRSTNIHNLNTTSLASFKTIKATSAIAAAVPSSNNSFKKYAHSTSLVTTVSSESAIARTTLATNPSKLPKLNSVPPTNTHRYPQERHETSSTDSINKELCYFKPIMSAPTMRWKSSSKSRGGAPIKMPLACLATNIQNLNCDECSIISARSSEEEQSTSEDEELKEDVKSPQKCHMFRPKPSSTLLTTIITSPTHHSAFARLVTQMKTLINIQEKRDETHSRITKKIDSNDVRNSAHRGRPSKASVALKVSQLIESPANLPVTKIFLRSRKQPFAEMKNINLSTEVILKKGKSETVYKSFREPKKVFKDKKVTSNLPLQVSTKKGKRSSKKSGVINIAEKGSVDKSNRNIQESNDNEIAAVVSNEKLKVNQRKRKGVELCTSAYRTNGSERSVKKTEFTESDEAPPLRKSGRLLKDLSSEMVIGSLKQTTAKKHKMQSAKKHSTFSPPMTRSRLKKLMQQHWTTSDSITNLL